MSYVTVYTEVEVDLDDVMDAMGERELKAVAKKLEEAKLGEDLDTELTPRQVLLKLRNYNVDLVGLRDAILEVLPLSGGE